MAGLESWSPGRPDRPFGTDGGSHVPPHGACPANPATNAICGTSRAAATGARPPTTSRVSSTCTSRIALPPAEHCTRRSMVAASLRHGAWGHCCRRPRAGQSSSAGSLSGLPRCAGIRGDHGRSPRVSATVSMRMRSPSMWRACAPCAARSLGVDRRALRVAASWPRELQHQDRGAGAVVAQRGRRAGDRQQHALARAPCSRDASQRNADALATSACGRPSPSCSSQRASSKLAPRPASAESWPASVRTATSPAPRPISTSGLRPVGASIARQRWAPRPSSRQRVLHSAHHSPPATISTNASVGMAGTRPTAPGRLATQPAHHTIASMPHPMTHSGAASEPERHGDQRRQRRRHDDEVADRDGDEVGEDGELLRVVEVVDAERRHGQAGHQRRGDDAAEEQQPRRAAPRASCQRRAPRRAGAATRRPRPAPPRRQTTSGSPDRTGSRARPAGSPARPAPRCAAPPPGGPAARPGT